MTNYEKAMEHLVCASVELSRIASLRCPDKDFNQSVRQAMGYCRKAQIRLMSQLSVEFERRLRDA